MGHNAFESEGYEQIFQSGDFLPPIVAYEPLIRTKADRYRSETDSRRSSEHGFTVFVKLDLNGDFSSHALSSPVVGGRSPHPSDLKVTINLPAL